MSNPNPNPPPNPAGAASVPPPPNPQHTKETGRWGRQPLALKSAVVGAIGVAATVGGLIAPTNPPDPNDLDVINGCSLEGLATQGAWQWRANPLKNRWNLPSGESINAQVTFAALHDAPTDKTKVETLPVGDYATQTTDGVTFDESQSAEIDGYIADVQVGGDESCNCGTKDVQYMDTHIYLAGNMNDALSGSKANCIIVEVTPRVRALELKNSQDWSTKSLTSTLKVGTHVRITGWLFDDQEHTPNSVVDKGKASLWRASCWEIHPVTDIQILGQAGAASKG